jgi:hypothetical protein
LLEIPRLAKAGEPPDELPVSSLAPYPYAPDFPDPNEEIVVRQIRR